MLGSFSTNGCIQVQHKQIVREKEEKASTENAQGPPGIQGWAWLCCSSGPCTPALPLYSAYLVHTNINLCILKAWSSSLFFFGGELALLFDRGALGSECVFGIVFEMTNLGITGLELPPHFPSHFVSFSASIQSRFCQSVTPSLLPPSQVCSPIHVPSALLILCYNNKQCSTRSAK